MTLIQVLSSIQILSVPFCITAGCFVDVEVVAAAAVDGGESLQCMTLT